MKKEIGRNSWDHLGSSWVSNVRAIVRSVSFGVLRNIGNHTKCSNLMIVTWIKLILGMSVIYNVVKITVVSQVICG